MRSVGTRRRMPAGGSAGTSRFMRRPGANHLDRRRRLLPRDYLDPPEAFGLRDPIRWVVPADGDGTSQRVARVEHRLVVAWRLGDHRPSGPEMGRRFGFSRQTWSRCMLGERWMGETVLAAVLSILLTDT